MDKLFGQLRCRNEHGVDTLRCLFGKEHGRKPGELLIPPRAVIAECAIFGVRSR